ncbi:hypothetical protein ACI3PL_20650, partial [Lacticaseibacillus paracasei]
AFYEIMIFVALAAIITPLHHRFQHWVINKLKEWNSLKHQQHLALAVDTAGEEIRSLQSDLSTTENNSKDEA